MKRKDYIRILLAPLGMLTVFACSPNQFQTNQEYDDVYFTSSDRMSKPTIIESTEEVNSSNEQAFSLGDYSNESVDPVLVSKYNNGQSDEVTYYEVGLRVKQASELNYDDFVFDYENENLAYYDLPLDWESDWDRSSFNRLMLTDYQFQLAWYDQYYLGSSGRMNSYLSGTTGRANRRFNSGFGRPSVGIDIGFSSFGFSPFYSAGMTFVNLNPFGFYDPFWVLFQIHSGEPIVGLIHSMHLEDLDSMIHGDGIISDTTALGDGIDSEEITSIPATIILEMEILLIAMAVQFQEGQEFRLHR